ncbi:FtsH protease activity modulator HflK [Paroceanicella profunda]|uniref:Protein HflK n=1 Tax=Paroceanicella profunda TaxID=2579971 RepID=A0A5B8FHT2_9RHOB|nr:FtsH protease activity modulator HflK [Paroceanicella profunda]QDL92831.1 FtsH protease activity modulator HflK [Paroceanicella profunda]
MPYSNNGGPWGGGGGDDKKGGDDRGPWGNGNRPGGGNTQVPDIDRIVKKGQEQLRVLMGGKGGNGRPPSGGGGGGGANLGRGGIALIGLAAVGVWLFASFYTVKPEERAVELFLGKYSNTTGPGLNFAPWPVVTHEVEPVTRERVVNVGVNETRRGQTVEEGLMLTGDENIVDIDFQVVWNVSDLREFLFNLKDPEATISAVSESAMREVIGRSDLAPILNRDRAQVSQEVYTIIQDTLDSYSSGIHIVRVNFDKADPPADVIDSFRDVQAAEQERNRFEQQAQTYSNKKLAEARGEAAQLVQEAEAYRSQAVNEAQGAASRFTAIYNEYVNAKEVTRKRLYLETMERVLGNVDKVIIDPDVGKSVVPYLPLNELRSTPKPEDAQ